MDQDSSLPDSSEGPAVGDQRTVAEIAELAGGLAHELRNPLSTMMINLRLLAEDLQDGRVHPDDVRRRGLLRVEALRHEAERLHELFNQFLNLTGPYRLMRREVDLNGVIARLVEFFRPKAEAAGVAVCVTGTPETLMCPIDERLVRQALLNIVINAQQAMPDGGELRISIRRERAWGLISVSDTGVGMAMDQQVRIWRPFFSTKGAGSGLGLSITQRVVHEHGGSVDCESRPGSGTTFTVRLPLLAVQAGLDSPAG